MIILFTTRTHNTTHRILEKHPGIDFRWMSYERLLRTRSLRRATYIFSDLDRLHFWDLECIANIYRVLREQGARVLNDPALHRSRYQFLRHLNAKGINDFNVWMADETPPLSAYPVFLRTDSAHRGPLTELIQDPDALETAIEQQLRRGTPRRELLIVQYAAEPIQPGLYRKLSAYRIADRIIGAPCAHQPDWVAKYGRRGAATEELYQEEYRMITEQTHVQAIQPAFEASQIEYGRADFAFVQGRPQTYEINTNPTFRTLKTHPSRIRLEAFDRFLDNLVDALSRVDTPSRGPRYTIPDARSWKTWIGDLYRTRNISRWPRTP
ncbi:hypothetical protein [Thioalkalivibrio sp. ALJT]|uniref:hypothetical protein n=1 Tax=Thioalkalivibrio sp. ALJT TaxID=1158146 RepID=UPI00037328D7|nr:hypothetical protein [Thioalkalivibrio sp. ALJT]